ncbi:hypothetical protein Tco_1076274, partial [Tanacetum coccineum]
WIRRIQRDEYAVLMFDVEYAVLILKSGYAVFKGMNTPYRVFSTGFDHMLAYIYDEKWALFFCLPNKPLEQGLKLIHTDNDVHTLVELACRNEGTDGEVVGWVENDASLRCSSSTPFETRHPFQTRHKRKKNDNNQTWGELNKKLKRGVTFKRKIVVTKGQKSVGKGKQRVLERENKKPTGIVIREGGSVNVGSRSNSILNVGEMAAGVDNVGDKRDVKTRFVVLDLRAREDLGQQPLALTNIDQQNC